MNRLLAGTCMITCFLLYVSCDIFFLFSSCSLGFNLAAMFLLQIVWLNSLISFVALQLHHLKRLYFRINQIYLLDLLLKYLQLSREFHKLEFQCLLSNICIKNKAVKLKTELP